jgi:hypothetical protein
MGNPAVMNLAILLLACGIGLVSQSLVHAAPGEMRKQYWASSLSGSVDDTILRGLYEAVARGEVGWLDIDAKSPIPPLEPGINLILYHVGGNCYIGGDCDRFPFSQPTGDRWGDTERALDLEDPGTRKIVIADLVAIVQRGDKAAPGGAIVGVHLDNVHKLTAEGLAAVFNEFLMAVQAARQQGRISRTRRVGYVAKNNPKAFNQAFDKKLLEAPPLYQINENARLNQEGILDPDSRIAQEIGRRCSIPVFLKTFGSDIAYTVDEGYETTQVDVSPEMARRMAQMPYISGVAWSVDEANYHPTLFEQGAPVREVSFGSSCDE